MKLHFLCMLLVGCLAAATARSQDDPAPRPVASEAAPEGGVRAWHMVASFTSVVDGNIDHTADPVRAYGAVPSVALAQERQGSRGWGWRYELVAHNSAATDEWERMSHDVEAFVSRRLTKRIKTETNAEANWNGSSDDRENANTFGIGQRVTLRVTDSTRVSFGGAYRYKVYGEDPGTSGPSPYIGGKFDQRFPGDLRLTGAYKHQIRHSRTVRDRYARNAYGLTIGRPVGPGGGQLSIELEYRSQEYERLIKVAGRQVPRIDHRYIADVGYLRSFGDRSEVRWVCGLESRRSSDPSKRFLDPTFGISVGYRVR